MTKENLLTAVNAVTARNELAPGVNTSVIRLGITEFGIVDQIIHRSIQSSFMFSTPEQAKVSEVNLRMLDEVKDNNGVGLWLSPPWLSPPWLSPPDRSNKTGKILVAVRQGREIVEYDTTGLTFSGKDFAGFMTSLSKYSRKGYYFLDEMPWEILETIIPMPEAWAGIRSDQAEIKFNNDVQEILGQKDPRKFYLQRDGVDINLACQIGLSVKQVTMEGTVTKLIKNCGKCKMQLNMYMKKGDHCPYCRGEYLGC